MSIRVRRGATDRLPLTQGDSLLVKRYLTAGEYRELLRASSKPVTVTAGTAAGAPGLELDPVAAGEAMVLAYLLDWTFQDVDGRPLVIADQPAAVVAAALRAIDSEAYMEVQRAIQQHQADTAAALEAEKKTSPSGATSSGKILTSVG